MWADLRKNTWISHPSDQGAPHACWGEGAAQEAQTPRSIHRPAQLCCRQIILCSVSAGSNASLQTALRIWMAQCQATRDAGTALPHYGPQSQGKHHLDVLMCVSSWPGRALNVIAKVNIPIPTQWRIFYRLLIGTWLSLRCKSGQKSLYTNLTYHEKACLMSSVQCETRKWSITIPSITCVWLQGVARLKHFN
jgi:hypothetical protein